MKIYLLAAAVLVASSTLIAQPGGRTSSPQTAPKAPPLEAGDGQKPPKPQPMTVTGKVESLNVSQRGDTDAIIVTSDGKRIQLNLSPDLASAISTKVKVGDTITAMVMPPRPPGPPPGQNQNQDGPPGPPPDQQQQQSGGGAQGGQGPQGPQGAQTQQQSNQTAGDQPPPPPPGQNGKNPPPPPPDQASGDGQNQNNQPPQPDHPVFHAVKITDSTGTTYGSDPKPPQTTHVDSKVKSLNFDRQGSVNGYTLESGETVMVPPPVAKTLNLKVGDTITVDGNANTGPNGATVIRATSINGTDIPQGPPPHGPGGPGQGQQGSGQQQGQGGMGQGSGQQNQQNSTQGQQQGPGGPGGSGQQQNNGPPPRGPGGPGGGPGGGGMHPPMGGGGGGGGRPH